ncbi:MAG TPA: septal ring lytic transglycosylase RlpA family protein [Verrucomicrobiae bacterium]|nr:septal ring lytic transglycosylase RlpA family protein [Verrucomicrobiae bacterium]
MATSPLRVELLFALRLALILALSGCSTTPSRPIPPSGPGPDGFPETTAVPPDLHALPDAVPTAEPRSRYGNPKQYEVMGERYFVMNSAAGYKERGGASWYGTKFNGKRTSSGEPYDMFAMTAAHKTLPLPTYVRVTRISNGKSVIVKVNDRGPFHEGRIIDLSYAAATRLDMLKAGSAEVEVEALEPASPPLAPAPEPSPAPLFLEVATTDDPVYAVALREEIAGLGIGDIEIRSVERDGNVLHRVIAGPFKDAAGREAARQRLAAKQHEAQPVTE